MGGGTNVWLVDGASAPCTGLRTDDNQCHRLDPHGDDTSYASSNCMIARKSRILSSLSGTHLGSKPLGQFRYQSHKPPSVLISPEQCFDAGRPAHDMIPSVREMNAERSRHASTVCHHTHLSIVEDRPGTDPIVPLLPSYPSQ
jgi:hypothetical protein